MADLSITSKMKFWTGSIRKPLPHSAPWQLPQWLSPSNIHRTGYDGDKNTSWVLTDLLDGWPGIWAQRNRWTALLISCRPPLCNSLGLGVEGWQQVWLHGSHVDQMGEKGLVWVWHLSSDRAGDWKWHSIFCQIPGQLVPRDSVFGRTLVDGAWRFCEEMDLSLTDWTMKW